ncbi:junctional cadherin 5-associated protein [Thunnus thynnus]|uniref:junctional protein associated with coronary artery disease n=1 Tax=Thunnus maccoyii TaxID=8240 RepID=UPI001C4D983C|nr:junctional protein associated with coronary artery disease [Thunnus maccoyii]XP_042255071.1 junctional protein associated with coronary artery disease [Thunnus maccoyii]XP_042255072.1 junctional protein associated with coronary artery disease [Thunnus maccoyii]
MYSVEDLLISHGYKLPKHTTSSSTPTPTPAPASSSHQASSSSPPSYSKHHEILENRPGPRTVNGYERGSGAPYGNSGGTRQPQVYASSCPSNNNEPRDRSQSRREGESRNQIDTHSLGESLTSDSGFCDGSRGPQSQSKDVSYWRRRGQDFTVLLDYADLREPHGAAQGGYNRPEGPQQARGQEVPAEERQRAAQERQRWAAQAQAHSQAQAQVQAQAQAHARSREREAALHQWRMATERKCQSLGTDEWRPAVSFSRQLSQSEGERWAQEQQRLHARTPEGMVVHPRTKAKSQSLPRMLQPESLQYVDIASSGQELYRRVNGHPLSHHNLYRAPRWPENGRPASANQLLMTPKPRFTRPPRPPSYEMHQQIRGSCEVLSGRDSAVPQARDRTPLPLSRTGDTQLDYFAQDSGPPGYIPPPSYKRAPMMGGGHRGYGEIAVDYRYRGDLYQQIQVAPDGSHWFTRHPAGSWPDPQRERSMSSQKQLYPVYTTQERPGGGVQYIPFDDPRIRHISSALGGNSLTDADKIRHIRNELPSVTVSEPVSDDSAFLPPPLGPFIAAKLAGDANQTSSSDFDNDNNRWHSNLHKETVDNFPATDQNCNNRYPKNQRPPPSPSSAFQVPLTKTSSRQGSSSDQVFAETITQVKKIVPESGPENNRNTKRRVSETIFCLVSVPVHTPTNINKDSAADQNNNETIPSLTVTNTDTFAVGLKETQNLRSKSVNEMPIKPHYHFHTSSTSSMRNYKRAPLRKEIIDAWALQANEDKELCYAGSWPGNQYRNQETQTGSPLTVVKSPEPQSPPGVQEPVQSASSTTTDSGMGADSSSSYGYPMTGQKNLHPSSNSAFSRLSLSPTQPPLLQPLQDPSSPFKDRDQGDLQPSSPRKSNSSPPESAEQVVFGQFLLKPVNRRPCDAIGELESINKEMEDTISRRPNVGQCIDDLDGVKMKLDRFKSGAHFTAGPEPGREAISLPPMHMEKPNNIKVRSKSFASTADLDSMVMRSAFSRPQTNNLPSTNEVSIIPCPGPRDNCLLSSLSPHSESNRLYRQDIPVPQESLLRDVGLTVYTETPGGPGEPMQRSLSVPSPLDHKELSQSLQLSWESRTALVKKSGSPKHNLNQELKAEGETERKAQSDDMPQFRGELSLSICRTRSESNRSPKSEGSPHVTRLRREVSFVFEGGDGDERYSISEPLTYKNESTIADKHLENLLIQEKANALPAEDLSKLYEVKCAKGIPENESIEQRAARILGIAVPVEALGVADKQSEDNQDDTVTSVAEKLQSQGGETQQVIGMCEQVKEDSLIVQGAETEEVKETGSGLDQEEDDRQKHSNSHDGEDNQDTETQSAAVLDLPEFPPSKLPLSLPVSPDEKLALSMCTGEKKGRGGTCKLIESLQDKLSSSASSSATSLGRSTPDRMARLKELDSVSRIRRLSLKGSESEGEVDSEERDGDREESEVQEETKGEVVEKQEDEEDKKAEKGERKEEENPDEHPDEHENAHEIHDKMGDPEEDCEPKEENEGICKGEQRQEEETEEVNVEIALKVEKEGSREDVELKTEELDREVELEILEDDKEKPVEVRDGQNAAEVSRAEATQDAEGEKFPKPKQRTRLQKPPLLPKPRSVPKREITLPLSFSTGTCGPSNMEDEEMLSVSDSYDPSRVERV